MDLCLRVDLDYVPWDTPDAQDFGHGEPAMLVKLLELGRQSGAKFHFFASNRSLRAFPTAADAVLNDGHHLDWLCKHPAQLDARWLEAQRLFGKIGTEPQGFAIREAWPEDFDQALPPGLKFLSCPDGPSPEGVRAFVVGTRPERDALRAGVTARSWMETVKGQLRTMATKGNGATVVIRPQVLAKVDIRLAQVKELLDFSRGLGLRLRTLREQMESA